MAATAREHRFENGLCLLVEEMPHVRSAAVCLMTPGGCIYEPVGINGAAAVLADVITRGAGDRDSRTLSDAFDHIGAQRSEAAGWSHITFRSAAAAEAVPETLRLLADVVRRPHLPDEEVEPAVEGLRQSLQAVEDEPQRKIGVEFRRRLFRDPWGRSNDGTLGDLVRVSPGVVQRHWRTCVGPRDAVLAVAGAVEFEAVRDLAAELLEDWPTQELPQVPLGTRGPRRSHVEVDSTQTQIAVAHDSARYQDDGYFAAWALSNVLGGGSSSRLFTEVREKRGLCYSIHSSLATTPTEGRLTVHAGTTVERAQETLDLTLKELTRLPTDLSAGELDRCKAQAKSSLLMQMDSTSSRAGGLARDWIALGKVRPVDEVRAAVEGLTVESLLDEWHRHRTADLTLLTLGPQPLEADESLFE